MNPLFNSSRWGKSTACACLDCDTTYGSVLTNCPCSHTTGGGTSLPQVSSTISDQDSSHVHCYSLVFCCPTAQTPWLAGCPHSAQRGWLIICQALWGMRPTCQQRAQCFSSQQWRLESEADPATLQAKRRGNSEGRRDKGSKGEQVVFLTFTMRGSAAQTVFCNSHSHLGQTQWHYWHIITANHSALMLAQGQKMCSEVSIFSHQHVHDVPLMQRAPYRLFLRSVVQECSLLCSAPVEMYRQTGNVASDFQDKTLFFLDSTFKQVDSHLLSVVQTAACYTVYLLPTQLLTPSRLHGQQSDAS